MALLSDRDRRKITETVHQLSNAALVEVAAPGPPAPNGDTDPVAVWTGEAACFLDRDTVARVVDGAETLVETDVVRIYDGAAPVDYLAGADWDATTVVIEDRRSSPVRSRWAVRGAARTADGTLDSIRLELDDPKEVTP